MAFCAWQPRDVSSSRDHELVDLHCHSTLSDGTLSVREMLDVAVRRKLSALAITDHDNIDSFTVGLPIARELGIDLVPGVEISSYDGESDVHILGYFFDPTNLALNQTLERIKRRRVLRVKAMVRKLNKLGMELRLERVLSYVHGGTVGRPHIARALLEEEYVGSFQEAFEKWLSPGMPAYVDSEGLNPVQAVALIRNAGGVAVMAHPHHTNRDIIIPRLVEAGLSGIEIYCWKMPQSATRRYQEIARKHNLVLTGGSDSHGEKPGIPGIGSVRVSRSVLDKLLEARDRHFAEF